MANENDKSQQAKKKEDLPAEIARAIVALKEDRWQLKEFRNPGHWICVPAGTTIEDVLDTKFWANIARKAKPFQTVEVHWDDASQFAEVYVTLAGQNWAAVSLLRHVTFERPGLPPQAREFVATFAGPVDKWRVMRIADNALIRAGFNTEREAQMWIDDHVRRLAA